MDWLRRHLRAWFWLMLLQTTWSYRRMQTIGWLQIARPWVERIRVDSAARLLGRLVVHFNTHPLLAPLLVGAAIHELRTSNPATVSLEEAHQRTEAAAGRLVRWMGTFGALGDMLYWRGLMWNVGWAGVISYAAFGVPGLAAFALLWFMAELGVRIYLFEAGLHHPGRIERVLKQLAAPERRRRLNRTGLGGIAVAGGFTFGLLLRRYGLDLDPSLHVAGILGGALALLVATRTRFRGVVLWMPPMAGWIGLFLAE